MRLHVFATVLKPAGNWLHVLNTTVNCKVSCLGFPLLPDSSFVICFLLLSCRSFYCAWLQDCITQAQSCILHTPLLSLYICTCQHQLLQGITVSISAVLMGSICKKQPAKSFNAVSAQSKHPHNLLRLQMHRQSTSMFRNRTETETENTTSALCFCKVRCLLLPCCMQENTVSGIQSHVSR